MRQLIPVFLTLCVIAGCDTEPSAGDMRLAMESAIKANTIAAAVFPGFEKFEKLQCQPVEAQQGFDCSFRATTTILGQPDVKEDHSLFVKTEAGWAARS